MEERAADRDTLAELTALVDELLEQAAEVRRQWADLSETLSVEPAAPEPAAASGDADAAAGTPDADPERLVALDMMLSGQSREEVRDHLHATFGEADRERLLDEVFSEYGG
jgi:hypothetical protein